MKTIKLYMVLVVIVITLQCKGQGQIVRRVLEETDKTIRGISRVVTGGLLGNIRLGFGGHVSGSSEGDNSREPPQRRPGIFGLPGPFRHPPPPRHQQGEHQGQYGHTHDQASEHQHPGQNIPPGYQNSQDGGGDVGGGCNWEEFNGGGYNMRGHYGGGHQRGGHYGGGYHRGGYNGQGHNRGGYNAPGNNCNGGSNNIPEETQHGNQGNTNGPFPGQSPVKNNNHGQQGHQPENNGNQPEYPIGNNEQHSTNNGNPQGQPSGPNGNPQGQPSGPNGNSQVQTSGNNGSPQVTQPGNNGNQQGQRPENQQGNNANNGPQTSPPKGNDEKPTFVALNPDQYTYGADGIKVEQPNANAAEDTDDFSIDVRTAFDEDKTSEKKQ